MTRNSDTPPTINVKEALWYRAGWEKEKDKRIDGQFLDIEKDLEETKRIALKAKRAAAEHVCIQEDRVRRLEEEINNFTKLKVGSVLAILTVFVALVGQWYTLQNKTENTEKTLATFSAQQSEDTEEIRKSVETVTAAVNQHLIQEKENEKVTKELEEKRLSKMTAAIKEAIKDTRRR